MDSENSMAKELDGTMGKCQDLCCAKVLPWLDAETCVVAGMLLSQKKKNPYIRTLACFSNSEEIFRLLSKTTGQMDLKNNIQD